MRLTSKLAALALASTLTFSFAGCEKSRDELRPDMDRVMNGDNGPQCADLREMASRLAPKVLQIDDIVRNPTKIVVVVKHMENKTENMPGRDMDIYLAKIAGNLNSAAASDRIAFVEERAKTLQMQAQELGNPDPFEDAARTGQGGGPGIRTPQYFLYGTVYSMNNGRTSYYLFQYKLTKVNGDIVWSGQYDVRTLN